MKDPQQGAPPASGAGGRDGLALVHPKDRQAAELAMARAFRSGVPQIITCRQRQADGRYRAAPFRAEPAYGVAVPVAPLVQEPGERWTEAAALGETVAAVEAAKVIEAMHGAAFAFDATGHFTYATPVAQTSIAMTLDDLNRRLDGPSFIEGGNLGWKLGVHPDDYEAAATQLRHCLRTGEPFNFEYRVLRATGAYVWHRFTIRPTRAADGHITGWYGVGLDIDVYKKTEAALRDSENRLRQLIETLPAMVYCARPDGRPTFRSETLRRFIGLSVEEGEQLGPAPLGPTLATIIHPDDLPEVQAHYRRCLGSGELYSRRHRLRRADGVYRWVQTRAAAMRNGNGDIVQWNGICIDIDEQVRAEEALSTAQERLARAGQAASLAELSASIAHEVNQPLAAIVANSQAAQRWLAAVPPNLERAAVVVERIVRDANAAADVVGHIRALFQQGDGQRESTPYRALVAEARALIAEEAARRGVRLVLEGGAALPPLVIDRVQVQQVLVNLMRNGMEAMEGVAGPRDLRVRIRRAGTTVRTEVLDRGSGIAAPERIFEPFFSTKAAGMGMGLAICRSIVESHGGRLWAEAHEGGGARLVFTLPILEAAP